MELDNVWPARSALSDIVIRTRLLPIQVLGRRATNAAFKYQSLMRMLHLETGNPDLARNRTRSFLNDMGTESKLSLVPDFQRASSTNALDKRAFPMTLPLHDLDHGLHHVMEQLKECWHDELGVVFDKQLNALSKYFSKRDNAERFTKLRIMDSDMPPAAKATLRKVILNTCPVFLKHRWEYRYDVLTWVCEREQLLRLLAPGDVEECRGRDGQDQGDDNQDNREQDFTDSDLKALQLLYSSPEQLSIFWALAFATLLLARWGHKVVKWLHSCHCHPTVQQQRECKRVTGKPCPWNGRRLIELSCGAFSTFVHELKSLAIERDQLAGARLSVLQRTNPDCARTILEGFATAKRLLEARFVQLTSFVTEMPWCLAKLLRFMIDPGDASAEQQSRADAGVLLTEYDSGRVAAIGDVGKQFLMESDNRERIRRWARGQDAHMHPSLFRELISFGTSLLCMQRLEAKHHLVHVRVATSRAMSVALMSANLRRSLHSDLVAPSFRRNLARFLSAFCDLVPETWSSMKELQSFTTGLNLNVMFADRSEEQMLICLADETSRGGGEKRDSENRGCFLERLHHLMSVTKKGQYYAVPLKQSGQSDADRTHYLCFQLLGFRPGNKKYMQRLTNWGSDVWHGALMCSTLGLLSADKPLGCEDQVAALPNSTSATFESSTVQPWQVEAFFENDRVDHLYRFDSVQHDVDFDVAAIQDLFHEDACEDSYDIEFLTPGCIICKHRVTFVVCVCLVCLIVL